MFNHLIGSRSCAFQQYIDKARALPLSPKRWLKNTALQFLCMKKISLLIKVCYKNLFMLKLSAAML